MTKAGYTHIIVPRNLHAQLKDLAQAQGLSIARLIQNLLNHSINTGINTTLRYPRPEKEPILNSFPRTDLKIWCSGGDLNPRLRLERPYRTPTVSYNLPLEWKRLREGFLEYVQRYEERTAKNLVGYLDRHLKGPIRGPMDVIRIFNGLSVGQQHHLNRALRALFNFAEIMGYSKAWLDSLRAAIPKDRIGIDLRVPEPDEILRSMRKVSSLSVKYRATWNLCLDSGLRLVEAVKIINEFDPGRLQKVDGFYRYEVATFRESKQAYYAYFTENTLSFIEDVEDKVERNIASHVYSRGGVVNPKYLRKFAFDKMIELEIPESVADFIEGRVPKKIGAKHYMVLRRQADRFYPRYGRYVESLRRQAGLS